MVIARRMSAVLALGIVASLAGPAPVALADVGQEQACAAYFADHANEPFDSVRVVSSKPSKHGNRSVVVKVPGMSARCNVDAHYDVVGFRFLGDVN